MRVSPAWCRDRVTCLRYGKKGLKKKIGNHFYGHRLHCAERTPCLRPVVLHLYISHWSRVVPLPPPAGPPSLLLVASRRGTMYSAFLLSLSLCLPPFSVPLSFHRSPFLFLYSSPLKMPSKDLTEVR